MNRANCSRDSFLRKTTAPSAAAPCSWNTFFARSTPMMLTSSMDALSFSSCFDTTSMAHRDAVRVRAASTPSPWAGVLLPGSAHSATTFIRRHALPDRRSSDDAPVKMLVTGTGKTFGRNLPPVGITSRQIAKGGVRRSSGGIGAGRMRMATRALKIAQAISARLPAWRMSWLAATLARVPDCKINRVDDVLPWKAAPRGSQTGRLPRTHGRRESSRTDAADASPEPRMLR